MMINPKDSDWGNTSSGRLFDKLSEVAEREDKKVSIRSDGSSVEIFSLDGEIAHLYKRLTNATVGDNNGIIRLSGESFEYHRFKWWKEVIDKLGLNIKLLDPPLTSLLLDTEYQDKAYLFSASEVIKRYGMVKNPRKEWEKEIAVRHWIQERIYDMITEVLPKGLSITKYDQKIRLASDEGTSPEKLKELIKKIPSVIDRLEKIYEKKS